MKKTLAVILVAVMLLSTLVALVVPAAAAEDNNWEVYNTATIDTPEEQEKAPPLPGYKYDETGFHTISPNYTNFSPKFTVISKEMYDITNFSMTFVVHDYCVTGDNWISISVWSESNGLAQGDVSGAWGDGWTSIIRPVGDVLNRFESWNATKTGRLNKQQFIPIDGTQTAPVIFDEVIDDNGDRVLTFSIENGVAKINGKTIGAGTDSCISTRFPEGLAYVGITLHNTDNTGTYFPTISITNVNGEVPTGTDSREPENKSREIAPPVDSNTVPYGQPALWFDATLEATNKTLPNHTGCDLDFAEDNKSILVKLDQESFQITFTPPDDTSYKAEDFTYFAIVYKNFCVCELEEGQTPFADCSRDGASHQTTVWPFAGKHASANPVAGVTQIAEYFCVNPLNEDGTSAVEGYYTVGVFQIINPEEWNGRINGFRLDVNALKNFDEEGHNTMEIMGAGFFRSAAELSSYIGSLTAVENNEEKNLDPTEIDIAFWDCEVDGCFGDRDGDGYCDLCWLPICEHVDEDGDNVCDLCGEDMPSVEPPVGGEDESTGDDTTEKETEANTEAKTESNAADNNNNAGTSDDSADKESGCGSVVSMGALAIVAILGTGLVIKKKED